MTTTYLASKPRYEILDGLPASTHVFVAVSIFILAIAIAYASLKLYDEPVREWLKRKLF